jgi:transposase-like protein
MLKNRGLRKQVNVNKVEKCAKCGADIPLYVYMYREERAAPRLNRFYCKDCGKEKEA